MNFRFQNQSLKESFFLILKGIAMGAANKVPGVSGGIVALVGGFYEELIFSFQHLNANALKLLFSGRFRSFWEYTNARFLCLLFSGVLISYFSVSLFLDYALEHFELEVFGAFFGMILASLYYISKDIKQWNKRLLSFSLLGFVLGVWLSFSNPTVENDHLLFVFFCGIISVSGMTIPGLSGSFLLLILGNYNLLLVDSVNALFEVITHIIALDFSKFNDSINQRLLRILFVFFIGALSGLILFANGIKWVLIKYPKFTIATIIGFIAGSLPLVYPWKVKTFETDFKGMLLTNSVGSPQILSHDYILPNLLLLETYNVIFAILFGIGILYLLNRYDKKRKR